MNIKLVVVDLDKTLLLDDNTVTQRTAEVFRRARQIGIKIAVATGRAINEGMSAADAVGADEYMIALTGCQLYDRKRKKNLFLNRFKPEQAVRLANILKEYDETFYQLYTTEYLLSTSKAMKFLLGCSLPKGCKDYAKNNMTIVPDVAEFLQQKKLSGEKYLILSNNAANVNSLQEKIREVKDIFIARSLQESLEVMPKGTNKGAALRALREHMGLKRDEIMVIGDSENDSAMFAEGGLKVAVGNAFDSLKQKADYVAPPYDRDGAAYAVEKFLLKG